MQLYLVQHGAAKSEAEDPQRGLTDEGKRTIERMAACLAPLGFSLDRIEHSEKLRARQTAEILAERLGPREGVKQIAGIAPNDDVQPMMTRLVKEEKNIMLVGHLPYLSRLVARLFESDANRVVVQFQMGGVVRIDRDAAGQWVVRWALAPEVLMSFK
jgi:phosphohistidine phosphatase